MPLSVLHSFIHQTEEKTTSLTISLGDCKSGDCALFMTLSDKTNKNRVKLDVDEVPGLQMRLRKARAGAHSIPSQTLRMWKRRTE